MRLQQTAAILAFPAGRRGRSSAAESDTPKGVLVPLRSAGGSQDEDLAFNATWEEMARLAMEAWSWRDPESLARLEGCVERLWSEVERDWGSEARRGGRVSRTRRYFAARFVAASSVVSALVTRWVDLINTTRL